MTSARPPNPVGPLLEGSPARRPSRDVTLSGRFVSLIPLSMAHTDALYRHMSGAENAHLWDYMHEGPFYTLDDFRASVEPKTVSQDPVFYAIVIPGEHGRDSTTTATAAAESGAAPNVVGFASLMRIDPTNRCVEVGHIMYSPTLQRTLAATEALYLLAKYAFEDLGYRRYEWKCNALNAPSRRAALRLGFTFEGIFRKHMIVKGRSRDTAWFAILDEDWPGVKKALVAWLDPSNFDESGGQRRKLEDFRE